MTVRDPGYDPRSSLGPDPSPGAPRRPPASSRGPGPGAVVAIALVAIAVIALGGGVLAAGFGDDGDPTTRPVAQASLPPDTSPAAPGGSATGEPGATDPASPPPAASPEPTSPATTEAEVAIVPVTHFRTGRQVLKPAELRAIAGGEGVYKALVLVDADADPILDAIGLERNALGSTLITVPDAAALRTNLAKNRTRVGFLRVDQVDESIRALDWASKSLFGVGRVESLADWPLVARLQVAADAAPEYDPGQAWTVVAGGDILLDRGVALTIRDRGVDFPFDGGTVDITGLCKDCSPFGWDTPYTDRTGNRGALRDLVKGADLAIANFENPAPDRFRFHGRGTVFTANPAYLEGLQNVGIDWVSLANNHIGDAGRNGILQTMDNLDDYGIAHSGVGANRKAAHKAALIDVGEVTVGLLGYDTIAGYYRAGPDTPGSARMTSAALKADIKAARAAGAELVIVFPHWGTEYDATPFAGQRRLARAAVNAGADMVIGNHAHWAGAMEVHDGTPIWYALGNFVFDQTWSIPTMEGVTLELTFAGTDLVQAKMHPHLILDRAQPNFLDPLGDGRTVLSQIFRASKGLLPW